MVNLAVQINWPNIGMYFMKEWSRKIEHDSSSENSKRFQKGQNQVPKYIF